MVDGHAGGLHEGVDDDGADEAEAPADEVLAHRLRLGRPERDVLVVPVLAHHRPVVHVPPHVPAERPEFLGHLHPWNLHLSLMHGLVLLEVFF